MSDSLLRQTLEDAMVENGLSMKDLTVLAPQNDPFRVDTPARHRDGEWLAITARELGLGSRKIHLRGLHYMVIGRPKPDRTPYTNTEADWLWLSGDAGKAARWLGYIPFDQIVDQRNAEPEIRLWRQPEHESYISVGIKVDVPDVDDIEPRVMAWDLHSEGVGFVGAQPYKLVMVGEKSSLEDVLAPIAKRYQADLYLPTGEPSDTMIWRMAKVGADDGRPMIVFYFSDCDPSGWQMPVSVARKLQGFRAQLFEDLEFQVHRVALIPDQVREYGLPSTPLKDTERRADGWRTATGVEQTEIDALASLQPDLLRELATRALDPFFDATLQSRAQSAYREWREAAQTVVDASTGDDMQRIRDEAGSRLSELREQIDAINNALRVDASDFDLPEMGVPEADLAWGAHPTPLLDSDWDFAEQCQALIDSKAYRGGGR